jgi:dipeptidase E
VREARAVFVGGGNSFRLLRALHRLCLLDEIRRVVGFRRGVPPANVPAGTDLSFLLGTAPRFDAGR